MTKSLLFSIILTLHFSCRESQQSQPKVSIATAANIQYPMQAIVGSFIAKTGIDCEIIVGSSGKLTAQIIEGAPFDIFVSADLKYPEELYQNNKTTASPKIYAEGKLVLWTLKENLIPSLSILNSNQIEHIALANPKTAPYGQAALQFLKEQDFYPQIKEKLVYGESISQTNQFIVSKAADIGFTAIGVVRSLEMRDKGEWMVLDHTSHTPISQGAVLVKNEKGISEESQMFYNFLFSKEAKSILRDYGYIIPD